MDSLFGDKASIRPPAIATSDGPSDPIRNESERKQNELSLPESSSSKSKSKLKQDEEN